MLIQFQKYFLELTSTDLTTNSITSVNTHVHGNGNNGADTTAPK